ncbi:DUF5655 domain-containing protein [Nitrososphaera sp.]|uniref:DUF5655 domain-containing protein n=1 Tax=Nitrososphaera sp. TaxID=1971748 RepID=UPI0031707305
MRLFKTESLKLNELQKESFSLERDIQRLIEENLHSVFGLEFVASEFELHGLRIDTLGFDSESKSFVIIEYKRERNLSVSDQGLSYLYLMLSNKSDFILEYNEKFSAKLKREDIDWSQSRILFIAPEFTTHQQMAIAFRDLPVELWEIQKYKNGFLILNQIEKPATNESIGSISTSLAKQVSKEIIVYDENQHLSKMNEKIKELYLGLSSGIKDFGSDVEVKPKKLYVGFWRNQRLFATIKFPKNKLRIKLALTVSELKDPAHLAKPRKKGGSVIYFSEANGIPYVLSLVKQGYDKN